jgi:propanol-preferring alcohol dehydrogenase
MSGRSRSSSATRHTPDGAVMGMTMGHETAGHVASVGSGVTGVQDGDPVLVLLAWACGQCRTCHEGRDNACMAAGRDSAPIGPGLGPDGGLADYLKARARHLTPLGSLDPSTAGPLADTGLTPMHAINGARHRLTPGSTVVVIGIGGLGHRGLQILAATTGARIIAVDTDQSTLDMAYRHHADEVVTSDAAATGRSST